MSGNIIAALVVVFIVILVSVLSVKRKKSK